MLNEKLSNKFQDCFIIIIRADNLNDFIISLQDINANVKKINKHLSFYNKQNISTISTTKPPFNIANSISTKLLTSVMS